MKKEIIAIFIFMLMIGAVFPVVGIINDEKSNLLNRIKGKDLIFFDDVPIWEMGDQWIFKIEDVNINYEDEYKSLNFNIEMSDLTMKVVSISHDSYRLEYKLKVSGDFEFYHEEYSLKINGDFGKLLASKIEGDITLRKSDFGIEELNYQFFGMIKFKIIENPIISFPLPTIRVPVRVSLNIDFDVPYTLIDFPLSVDKTWSLPATTITVDGKITSIFLKLLNFINKIAGLFNIDLLPSELAEFLPDVDIGDVLNGYGNGNSFSIPENPNIGCFSKNDISVGAGTYNAYNITVPGISESIGNLYYASEVGYIIKALIRLDELLPPGIPLTISDFDFELLSTNYGGSQWQV